MIMPPRSRVDDRGSPHPSSHLPATKKKWKKVTLENTLTITGGYQNKSWALQTKTLATATEQVTMALVTKNTDWWIKLVKGPDARRDEVKRSLVLDYIRDRLKHDESRGRESPSAVAEAGDGNDDDDPMQELEKPDAGAMNSQTTPTVPPKKKWPQVPVKLTVPGVPRSIFPSNTDTKQIWAWASNHSQLYIGVQDLEWLVGYAAVEVAFGNVNAEPASSSAVAENCEVEHLHVRWCWETGNSYEAVFVDGPLKGETFRSSLGALTEEKWTVADGGRRNFGSTFATATYEQRRGATLEFLKQHCRKTQSDAVARVTSEA